MQPLALPIPYQGINNRVPTIAIQNPFCQNLLNFNNSISGLALRSGDKKIIGYTAPTAGLGSYVVVRIVNYNDVALFAVNYSVFGALLSITVVLGSGATTSVGLISATTVLFAFLEFKNYLFVFNNTSNASNLSYSGAAWAALGYTSASGYLPFGGSVFKNRVYLIAYGNPIYMYSGIDSISGALTEIDLSTIINKKSYLVSIVPITIAGNISSESYLSFIFASGEVLFYSGSYPDSTDWRLVGRASVSQPLDFHSYTQYQGDVLLTTDAGIVSLRDLFLSGSQNAQSLSVNANVSETWKQIVKVLRDYVPVGPLSLVTPTQKINILWQPSISKIIIQMPFLYSNGAYQLGSNYYLILDTDLGAFTSHYSVLNEGVNVNNPTHFDLVSYQSSLYYLVYTTNTVTNYMGVYKKEGQTDSSKLFLDDIISTSNQNAYSFEIISAPVTTNNGYVNKVQGMDVILESDLSATTEYTWIKELGVDESNPQKVNLGSGIQKPFINSGIEGTFIQYKISGTTAANKTVGLDLYGVNIWQDSGGSPR